MKHDELRKRLHAVMDDYKISHRNDLAFLGKIAWALGLELGFKLEERQLEPDAQDTQT